MSLIKSSEQVVNLSSKTIVYCDNNNIIDNIQSLNYMGQNCMVKLFTDYDTIHICAVNLLQAEKVSDQQYKYNFIPGFKHHLIGNIILTSDSSMKGLIVLTLTYINIRNSYEITNTVNINITEDTTQFTAFINEYINTFWGGDYIDVTIDNPNVKLDISALQCLNFA